MKSKILLLAKSIDGGTGTFVNSILKLENKKLSIVPMVLEKPSYRHVTRSSFKYFAQMKHYPEDYGATLKNVFTFTRELFWVRKTIKKEKPDLLLGIDIHSNLLLTMNRYFFFKGMPIILTTHTGIRETLLEKASPGATFLIKNFISFFYKRASEHICVSKYVARSINNTLELNTEPDVIYNGIKKRKLLISPLKENSPIFINISRLTKQKDHKTLLRAFEKVNLRLPKARLLVVGEGPEKKHLVNFVKKQKIGNVEFLGWRKNPSKILRKVNIFVLASHREGLPFSLIEAMSYSKAVISTKTPHGPQEVIGNNEYGILVPMRDEGKLASAMLKTAKTKVYKKYAKRAHERSKDFTEAKMLKEYRKVINESIN